MIERQEFSGIYVTGVDAKGRAAIPAALRSTLEVNGAASRVVIALHDRSPCLVGFDPALLSSRATKLTAQADLRTNAGEEVDFNRARLSIGLTETASYDASGRFVLPAFFAMKAKIEKGAALFMGSNEYFEIWNLDVLDADPDVAPQIKEYARFRRAEWTAK